MRISVRHVCKLVLLLFKNFYFRSVLFCLFDSASLLYDFVGFRQPTCHHKTAAHLAVSHFLSPVLPSGIASRRAPRSRLYRRHIQTVAEDIPFRTALICRAH